MTLSGRAGWRWRRYIFGSTLLIALPRSARYCRIIDSCGIRLTIIPGPITERPLPCAASSAVVVSLLNPPLQTIDVSSSLIDTMIALHVAGTRKAQSVVVLRLRERRQRTLSR